MDARCSILDSLRDLPPCGCGHSAGNHAGSRCYSVGDDGLCDCGRYQPAKETTMRRVPAAEVFLLACALGLLLLGAAAWALVVVSR